MAVLAPKAAASLPIYTVVALCGFFTQVLVKLLTSLTSSARVGGRAVTTAAAAPAFAAAGMIWEIKDQLHHSEQERTAISSLLAQPSVINWHEMPGAVDHQ